MIKTNSKILDLGCGNNKVDGAIGIDIVDLDSVDIQHDILKFPYPFENNSFNKIFLRHVIEHFNLYDIEKIYTECYRILENGGILEVSVPHVFSTAAFSDPTHKQYFTFDSGNFWDSKNNKSYYKEIASSWILKQTRGRVTWFDWKRPRLRYFDRLFSKIIEKKINKALCNLYNPSLADRIVNKYSLQFVEIIWTFQKKI